MTKLSPVTSSAKKHSLEWWSKLPPEKTGKETEIIVEKLFTEWNQKAAFAWHRLPDAKAARGRLAAQPADYVFFAYPNGGFVEVKACAHSFRLPKDKVRQHGVLAKFALAGANNVVLINHYLAGYWRCVRISELEFGLPSWDLSGKPTFRTAEEALTSTGYF